MRQYDIFVKERTVDTLNQQFTLFRQELQLERLGWTIKGDFLALSYQIYDRNGNMICEVDQELFHLTRQYYVNILEYLHNTVWSDGTVPDQLHRSCYRYGHRSDRTEPENHL